MNDASTSEPMSFPLDQQRRAWAVVPSGVSISCDVLVVGGGLSGVAAAVAAARRDVTVVLVEPTHMVGGQATVGGVSASDVTQYYKTMLTEYGLWGEIEKRTRALYADELRRPIGTSQYRDTSFSPNCVVLEHVLSLFLDEAGVQVLRNFEVAGVDRGGDAISVSGPGGVVTCSIVVDATEDGSLLRHAGVSHRLGNVVINGHRPDPRNARSIAVQTITQTATIQLYPGGVPPELVMREVPPGYAALRDAIEKSYPDGPRPRSESVHPNGFAGYRGAPDLSSDVRYTGSEWEKISRTSLNYRNDQRITAEYMTDGAMRRKFEQDAMVKTLAILFYLQQELGLPWAVATDEGFADGPERPDRFEELAGFSETIRHAPPIPYQRESRRLVGLRTLSGKEIFRRRNREAAPWDVDSVVAGTYTIDMHGGRSEGNFEEDLGESLADKPNQWREGPFPLPMDVMISADDPRVLGAEKNISVSRLVAGASRLHPTVVGIGEAVGTLAALAVRAGCKPDRVPSAAVQLSLTRGGASITPIALADRSRLGEDYPAVALAVARRLTDRDAVLMIDGEPHLGTDLETARRRGTLLASDLESWLA